MAIGLNKIELGELLVWRFLGESVSKAAATLPASTANDELFAITGGRILLTGILGEVTTVVQTQVNNTKIVFNPTATGSNVDMCAVLDITASAVATLFSITGTVTDAMKSGLAIAGAMVTPMILQPGTIELDTAATSTGAVKWTMWYLPLDRGAVVAAA